MRQVLALPFTNNNGFGSEGKPSETSNTCIQQDGYYVRRTILTLFIRYNRKITHI